MYFYDLKNKKLKSSFEDESQAFKADFISDLHLDFYLNEFFSLKNFISKFILADKKGEILIVAGDISHDNDLSIDFLSTLSKYYNYILVIPGNHDWYLQKKGEDRYKDLIESTESDNVIFLFDEVEVFEYKGVNFAGTMMMYNLHDDVSFYTWRSLLNDHKFIQRDFANKRNLADVSYYNKIIDKVDVFVSHIPIVNLDGLSATKNLFLNVDVNEKKDVLYISGHTHKSKSSLEQYIDYEGINVSFGYPSETDGKSAVTTVCFVNI